MDNDLHFELTLRRRDEEAYKKLRIAYDQLMERYFKAHEDREMLAIELFKYREKFGPLEITSEIRTKEENEKRVKKDR